MPTPPLTQIRPTEYLLDRTTILVVDDEPGPRESLKLILSPAHRVIPCSSGAEALEVLAANTVDVMTIDLNMPTMKGDDLMRRVRRDFPGVEIIIITGCGTVRTAVEGLRHGISDYISKPFDVVDVSTAVGDALARKRCREGMVEFLEGVGDVLGMEKDSRSLVAELRSSRELQSTVRAAIGDSHLLGDSDDADDSERMLEFLDVLSQSLESRDSYLRGHAQRVSAYAEVVARHLGLSSENCEHVRVSAFLHDFGKLALAQDPEAPARERSSAEGLIDVDHPELGARLVSPLGFPEQIALAIEHHHESWDGGGFPAGLTSGDIPLASRIIAAVDAYDLMVDPREGEPALAQAQALRKLEKQAGYRFDPEIVRTFTALVAAGELSLEDITSPASMRAAGSRA